MIPWWLLIPAFVGGGLVAYYYAHQIYAGGEALFNKVKAAATSEEQKVLNAIKSRL